MPFDISYWFGPTRDMILREETISEIHDAGMTIIEARYDPATTRKVAEMAQKYGMKVNVVDDRCYNAVSAEDGWEAIIEAIVNDYRDIPNINHYFLRDEPTEVLFPKLARLTEAFRRLAPDHPAYANMLGIPSLTRADYYEDFIEKYVSTSRPGMLSFDHYNLMRREVERLGERPEAIVSEEKRRSNGWQHKLYEKVNRPGFYDNLEVIRDVAARHGIPWKIYVLLTEHWDFRYLLESEIRWEAFTALAYGAAEVDYFTYATPPGQAEGWNYHHAMINPDGSRDSHWYMVQRINRDLALLGGEVAGAGSLAVLHLGFEPGEGRVKYWNGRSFRFGASAFEGSFEMPGAYDFTGNDSLLLGFFEGGKILLVNKNMDGPNRVSFAAGDGAVPKRLCKTTGRWEELRLADDGRYHLPIAAGDGELIK